MPTRAPAGGQGAVLPVATRTSDPLDRDFATVAYDGATGAVAWTAREDVSLVDRAWSLAVSPDGERVFVAGERWHSSTPGAGDYLVLAYETA